ncbi:MAG: hypothetical protein PHS80_03285 [Methanothrix sp.]|nr:hypothetical protein [Methanothrix sp.]MDD4446615.1 hypothetical protein [Methanothrix sp.]
MSIPQYVVPGTPRGTDGDTDADNGERKLDIVLADWLESSRILREALAAIMTEES